MRYLPIAIVLFMLPVTAFAQDAEFKDVKMTIQMLGKTEQQDVVLRYTPEAMTIRPKKVDKNKPSAARDFAYNSITAAEYTFGKHVRLAAGLLVSPLFFMNNSKSHWLTVKTKDDYAILRLDKGNYKVIMAELEKRAKITVASIGEEK